MSIYYCTSCCITIDSCNNKIQHFSNPFAKGLAKKVCQKQFVMDFLIYQLIRVAAISVRYFCLIKDAILEVTWCHDIINIPKIYINPQKLFTFDQRDSCCLIIHISPCVSQVFRTLCLFFFYFCKWLKVNKTDMFIYFYLF